MVTSRTTPTRCATFLWIAVMGLACDRDPVAALQDCETNVCRAEHIDAARRSMDAASNRHGLTSFDVRPRTTVHPTGPSEVWLRLRVPTPARERGRIEQEILRRFLEQAPRRASLAGYEAPSMSDTDEL